MDLKEIRIERLKQYARTHGVLDDRAGLGKLIGKEPNQVYNLLSGFASFGEKVARSIEQKAGLPPYWLDTEETQAARGPAKLSPEAAAIAASIDAFHGHQREQVLRACLQIIDLARNGNRPVEPAQTPKPQRRVKNG